MKLIQPNLISEHHSCVTKYIADAVAVVCSDARTHMSTSTNLKMFSTIFWDSKPTTIQKEPTFIRKEHDFPSINYPFIFTDYTSHWKGTVLFPYLQILWHRTRVNKPSRNLCRIYFIAFSSISADKCTWISFASKTYLCILANPWQISKMDLTFFHRTQFVLHEKKIWPIAKA